MEKYQESYVLFSGRKTEFQTTTAKSLNFSKSATNSVLSLNVILNNLLPLLVSEQSKQYLLTIGDRKILMYEISNSQS